MISICFRELCTARFAVVLAGSSKCYSGPLQLTAQSHLHMWFTQKNTFTKGVWHTASSYFDWLKNIFDVCLKIIKKMYSNWGITNNDVKKSFVILKLLFTHLLFFYFCLQSAHVKPDHQQSIITTILSQLHEPRSYKTVNSKVIVFKTSINYSLFLFFFLLLGILIVKTKSNSKNVKFTGPYLYLPTVWAKRKASLGRCGKLFPSRFKVKCNYFQYSRSVMPVTRRGRCVCSAD